MQHLICLNFIFLTILFSAIPSDNYDDWNIIQDDEIRIEYSWLDLPWCKAQISLNYSAEEILEIVEDVNNYYKIFDSVIKSKEFDENVVHIVLNLPIPFNDRVYVVKFNKIINENDIRYQFSSYESREVPISDDYVRLINASGAWQIKSINDNLTEVTYIWNGEMRGNFPSWSLKRVWLKQGNEVLSNLKKQLIDRGDIE